MKTFYAGIGSRETPDNIGILMKDIASELERIGYTLRSGGANGADSFFESGVKHKDNKEIYIPWKGFNDSDSELYNCTLEAFELADKYHPSFKKLSFGAKKLMARNGYQVLGFDLKTPVDFIVCWTPGGKKVGGTSQAIRIADSMNIKVFNLAIDRDINDLITSTGINIKRGLL